MPVIPIDDADDARLADYRHVPDPELLRRGAIFVAEGRLVVRALLTRSRFAARSLLLTETSLDALGGVLAPRLERLPVYVVPHGVIEAVTGHNIHRGCLAVGERAEPPSVQALLGERPAAARVVVLEQITNADNVGGVFRNAAAFAADAVVLGPNCCDPLYRKAIRVSMGAALYVAYAQAGRWPEALGDIKAAGFTVAALTPRRDAVPIDRFVLERGARTGPVAVLAGSEGEGLSDAALAAADVAVRIPMAEEVDSLNVATAIGIALHRLCAMR